MRNESESSENVTVQSWDPRKHIRRAEARDLHLSRGFLRCRPEKWFPAFAQHWASAAESLGCEVRIQEVKPVSSAPRGLEVGFVGSVDDEPIAVLTDAESARRVIEEVTPGASEEAKPIVLEYMARRLLSSMARSWSGPETSVVRFERDLAPKDVSLAGAVKLSVMVNTSQISFWVALGRRMVDRLDGLWRRQIQSAAKVSTNETVIRLELVQLGVPPQMLSDYLKSQTVIDLEVPVSDTVILRLGTKAWMPARLIDVNGKWGCEVLPGPVIAPNIAETSTKLCVELGTVPIDSNSLAELSQVGAGILSDITVSDRVTLNINNDQVAEAQLCIYEGRFAITVK